MLYSKLFKNLVFLKIFHSYRCMYICGMPGTGKTATVEKAVELLQRKYSKRKTAKFNLACLNCMKISNPRQSYVEVRYYFNIIIAICKISLRFFFKKF